MSPTFPTKNKRKQARKERKRLEKLAAAALAMEENGMEGGNRRVKLEEGLQRVPNAMDEFLDDDALGEFLLSFIKIIINGFLRTLTMRCCAYLEQSRI